MARKNFKDQAADFSADLITEDKIKDNKNITDDIVTTLEKTTEYGKQILLGDADIFVPFHDEKLRLPLREGEERERLVESIKQNGVMDPVNVISRPDGKFEILQGHNRVSICKELGIKVPYIIRDDLDEDGQTLVVVDSNILNRQNKDILPSQFAYILKKKFDAESHERSRRISADGVSLTGEKLGEEYGLSRKTIGIYIKLNELIDIAKTSLDKGELGIKTGYELAFFTEDMQKLILNLSGEYTVNDKNLHTLRIDMKDIEFTDDREKIAFVEDHLQTRKKQSRTFDYRNVKKYIPKEVGENEIEDYIIRAIKAYRNY